MNVLRKLWRSKGPVVVAWLFGKFITVLRLQPGDVLVVYDHQLLDIMTDPKLMSFPFNVPLINAEAMYGAEVMLFKQMNFKELTAIYQIALTAHQEAECERIQSSVSQG